MDPAGRAPPDFLAALRKSTCKKRKRREKNRTEQKGTGGKGKGGRRGSVKGKKRKKRGPKLDVTRCGFWGAKML